ncbi:hypothetical protein FIBSPDRAFT_865921 [Athelia psychrophila]|uniref:Uncharacterized protein n=1 Tax=Athelia psychrophila TaxID=1759441 RepID=A0A166F439_9AGAM|nr:hypothetical protein FIBSPDRAFT_865921 [Fibularhizoctonia sp. CBS 109695]
MQQAGCIARNVTHLQNSDYGVPRSIGFPGPMVADHVFHEDFIRFLRLGRKLVDCGVDLRIAFMELLRYVP